MNHCHESLDLKIGVRRWLQFVMMTIAMLVGAQDALACHPKNNKLSVVWLAMGNINAPRSLPVGAVITSKKFFLKASTFDDSTLFECGSTPGSSIAAVVDGTPDPSDPTIRATDVAGIGYRMKIYADSSLSGTYPFTVYLTSHDVKVTQGISYVEVELIKTAAVTGEGSLGRIQSNLIGSDGNLSALMTTMDARDSNVISSACDTDTGSQNISVQLGQVAKSAFKGVGTATASRTFNITLNCNATPGSSSKVHLRMDATPDPSGATGVLKLTSNPTGNADGVGIQLLNGIGAPINLGQDMLVGSPKDGSYVLPFRARYYQTGGTVTGGTANGTATFTLIYK